MSQDKVIEKIKKLLLRTEANGCTPAEAATAASQVAMILAKYNLTMADVSSEETELVKEKFVDTKSCNSYQATIASELSKHFGVCIYVSKGFDRVTRRKVSTLKVYGERIKVQAFREVYNFIYNAYQKCWTAYHKTLDITLQEKNAMRNSYVNGFIDGVTNEIIKEENANALVVSSSTAVEQFRDSLSRTHRFTQQAVYNAYAEMQGYQDGAFAQRNKHKAL